MQVHEKIVEEAMKDSWITSVGNVPFELYGHDTDMDADESPFNSDSEIKFIGKEKGVQKKHDDVVETIQIGYTIDLEMQEVDSDLESMPDDEILSVFRFEEAYDDDFKNAKDLSVSNEVGANNVVDELVDMANTQYVNLNIYVAKETNSDPHGHLQADITSLTVKVNHLDSSLSQQVANKIDDSVPRMLLKDSIKKAMPKFDKRIKKTIKAKVDDRFLKPIVNDLLRQLAKHMMQLIMYIEKIIHSSNQVPMDIMVINAKNMQTNVEKNAADIDELVELVRELMRIIDLVPVPANADTKGD
uniref:Uncharacterized protein n=1 Tax=Tanacetum cinerariifolium TaxID=118510 RepID=A0A6L2LNB0_TANCI|nr:hypothetical protein [Tanacetum cinerariifolium]